MRRKEDDWVYQYPSTTVKWKVVPTGANVTPYIGDANKLLYQTKNMMTFNELDQLRSIRVIFGDTGVLAKIIATSSFGQDFIEIQVPSVVVVPIPVCSITLFNVPETIQPMHWYEDGIHDSEWLILNPGGELEIEGVDYIKTYYFYSSENCDACLPDFTICDTDELETTYGWTAPQTCKPFVFVDATIPVNGIMENDHCIHGICQAEIIDFGGDENGSYFRWKAYTEWSSLGPTFVGDFTKTGLGYLLLRGFTKFEDEELCTSISSVIKVDCCLKVLADRTPIIYWEKCVGENWCVAPSSGTIEEDLDYFWQMGGWISMTLWAKENWCRPMTWAVTGLGEVTPSEDGTFGYYLASYTELGDILDALDCEASYQISITGSDRCGTEDNIIFTSTPCCDDAAALEIGYTTLAMSCSESQTLTAVGGCAPYSWSKSGGGTLTPAEDTLTALYEAAATNAECVNNATVTLTDCCGGSDSIQIAVNCYTPAATAYDLIEAKWYTSDCINADMESCGIQLGCFAKPQYQQYNCDGTLRVDWADGDPCDNSFTCDYCDGELLTSILNKPAPCSGACAGYGDPCDFLNITGIAACMKGFSQYCKNCVWNHPCGYSCDKRTADMKTQGCCPINPYTGLPY